MRCSPLEAIAQHGFTSKQLKLPDLDGWAAAAATIGGSLDLVRRVKQVHGTVVRVLARGATSEADVDAKPDGDAVVSNVSGLVLAVMVADRASGAAGAIHAGWRGTCARVGPSIGPDDYEVGDALVEAFQQAGHRARDLSRWFRRRDSRLLLDLWSANRDQPIDAIGLSATRASDTIATRRLSIRHRAVTRIEEARWQTRT